MTKPTDYLTDLSHERLKEILHYDPLTGNWTWLVKVANRKTGTVAGNINISTGYYVIAINYRDYQAHRLAWFYMTGKWPNDQIDHIDQNKLNNRWDNLREATPQQNNRNVPVRKNSTTGITGVVIRRSSHVARIKVNKKYIHLGSYKTEAEAIRARQEAEIKYFGEFRSTY